MAECTGSASLLSWWRETIWMAQMGAQQSEIGRSVRSKRGARRWWRRKRKRAAWPECVAVATELVEEEVATVLLGGV